MLKFNMVEVILEQLNHFVWLLDNGNDYKEREYVFFNAYQYVLCTIWRKEFCGGTRNLLYLYSRLISKKSSINFMILTLICFCCIYLRNFDHNVIKVYFSQIKVDIW